MKNNEQKPDFLFEKANYKLLLIGIAVIAYGQGWRNGEASARKAVAHLGSETGDQEPGSW